MNEKQLAKYIDNTLLKPEISKKEMEKFLKVSKKYGFATVCVQPSFVKLATTILKGSTVKVCTVIGFPLGVNIPLVKSFEAEQAMKDGAIELDMVINVGALKSKDYATVEKDIQGVVKVAHSTSSGQAGSLRQNSGQAGQAKKKKGTVVKVILETGHLTPQEIVKACKICEKVGVDFVKTSTGMGPRGASIEDVMLMKKSCKLKVKAAGGIRDLSTTITMINAGADRIGTSGGAAIVKELKKK
jgi:deoxyribose-phosphate aldolase